MLFFLLYTSIVAITQFKFTYYNFMIKDILSLSLIDQYFQIAISLQSTEILIQNLKINISESAKSLY